VNLDQVLEHFKVKPNELAAILKVTRPAISQWKASGIPAGRQWQIEALTKGKLKAQQTEQAA
jgi:DNA-binding transcriptional regulator YdaS (Cro superfamily)